MDFLTGAAYWGIILLMVINAIVVLKMKVDIGDDVTEPASPAEPGPE